MAKNILIIGGTRYFGKRLVRRLLDAGHRVTIATRGRAADDFGDRVRRLVVDRRDAEALRRAAARGDHDLVVDQMCYSPLDARRGVDAFAGRAGRYVMTSTIEVYRPLVGVRPGPFAEHELPLDGADGLDVDPRWDDPAWAETRYGDGKRRAEAWLARDGRIPVVAVRLAHVLGGPDDFTGRLARHLRAARAGRPLALAGATAGASSFIDPEGAAAFLQWVGEQDLTGAINAASEGALDAAALHRRVVEALVQPVDVHVEDPALARFADSPFDYPACFEMDTRRARALGYRFGAVDGWLDETIRALDAAAEASLA